jgi:4'-phosphopantetheinyl transferase EntD
MVTRDSSKANLALDGHCRVASMDSRDLQHRDYTSHLSVAERTKYLALPSRTRKREWLAGRLAAKYVFLTRLETSPLTQIKRWRPTVTRLSADALDHYPAWMYRQVEVVTAGEKPGLIWCGQARPESVSLSHSCGMSCASVTFGAPTAIDIETAVPRLDAFYRINFSDPERRWANGAASSRLDWFFTFLWTVKESVLKLGCFPQTSIWNLPGIEIDGLPGVNNIGPFSSSNIFSSEFAVFELGVKQHSHVLPVQVAVTGTSNLILTVVNPLSGVVK